MRKTKKAISALLIFIFTALPVSPEGLFSVLDRTNEARADSSESLEIDHDTTWSGDIDVSGKYVIIIDDATLTIEKGSRIKVGDINVGNGRIVAKGTSGEKIVFVKPPFDPSVIPEENREYDPKCFMPQGGMIEFSDIPEEDDEPSIFEYVDFEDMGSYVEYDTSNCPPRIGFDDRKSSSFFNTAYASSEVTLNPAISFYGGKARIENSTFKNSYYADIEVNLFAYPGEDAYSSLSVSNSNLDTNRQGTALLSFSGRYDSSYDLTHDKSTVRLENNWYGSANGPGGYGLSGSGKKISGDYTLSGWSDHRFNDICADCASNVLFLPGIEGSNLYKSGLLDSEDQLWPPTPFSNDMHQLRMDKEGKSVEDVYTEDIIGSAFSRVDVYKSFIADLIKLRDDDEKIKEFDLFAYDWRQSVEDVVENGTQYSDGEKKFPTAIVDSLASSSKNGKVTIVAHSNGGLLAKAIMEKLKEEGKSSEVDKIVFVGTPQMGTPLTALTMLHGYEGGLAGGLIASDSDARELSSNVPGAYGLLPSEEYFKRSEDRLIDFSWGKFKDVYGDGLESYSEFKKFLTGENDNRDDPEKDDLESADVLNKKLLEESENEHDKMDFWTPPAGTKLIQIAGWGLDTVSGMNYAKKEETECRPGGGLVPVCYGNGKYASIYEPKFTIDGDKVVVAPSALMMPESDKVEKYWFDLHEYNDKNQARKHLDLFEADPIRNFVSNIITNKYKSVSLPEYIETKRPDDYDNAKPRIRMSLYSPLDIHLYDEQGNHTGPKTVMIDGQETTTIEEGIPNSYYMPLDGRKYVGIPSGENIKMEMDGYDSGSYTLKIDEVKSSSSGKDEILSAVVFSNLAVSSGTNVNLDIPNRGISGITKLTADYDGDGVEDYSVVPDFSDRSSVQITDSSSDSDDDSESENESDSDNEKSVFDTGSAKSMPSAEDAKVLTLTYQGIDRGETKGEAAESDVGSISCNGDSAILCDCRMESNERMIKTVILLVIAIYVFVIVQVAIVIYYRKNKK